MPLRRPPSSALDRLFGSAGVAALTAWAVATRSVAPPAPPAPAVIEAPAPALSAPAPRRRLEGRCVSMAPLRRAPPRDPFSPVVVFVPEPAPGPEPARAATEAPETPAQPLPERTISVAGEALSTAGLRRAQVRLLETLARLPNMPTERVRGARYIRFDGRLFRDDCSNALRIPYHAQGVDLFSEHPLHPDANGVKLIRVKGEAVATPEVGDLVIFDDTWDKNRNGALDDPDTHAAIVVGFEEGGTVLLYNRVRSGHRIFRMNLRKPHVYRDPKTKRRLNDFLRRKRRGDPEDLPRLTAELFARYVRVDL